MAELKARFLLVDHQYALSYDKMKEEVNVGLHHDVRTEPQRLEQQNHLHTINIKTEVVDIKEERHSPSPQSDIYNIMTEEIDIKEELPSPPTPNYQCAMCNKPFVTMINLRLHILYMHGRNRPFYNCVICHKQFPQNDLTLHMSIHRKEKPYECHVCHKRFAFSSSLPPHVRYKHSQEPLYECDICHKRYIQLHNLTIHRRIHTGDETHQCDICHIRFMQQRSLNIHMRIHTAEKLHQCDICYKQFRHKGELAIHTRTHRSETV